jgi:hypothetical protein
MVFALALAPARYLQGRVLAPGPPEAPSIQLASSALCKNCRPVACGPFSTQEIPAVLQFFFPNPGRSES